MSYTYTLNDLYEDIVIGIPSKATDYLFHRIQKENYRGEHLSQHNRYTKNTIIIILRELDISLKNNCLNMLQIRTTDISKRPMNTQDEHHYAMLTNTIAAHVKRTTQDSLRKTLFVDMARMGLINRFDANRTLNNPFKRSQTKFVNISKFGYEFLGEVNAKTPNAFKINRLWTDALNNLHNDFEALLYDFMLNLQAEKIDSINYDDFAFFVSDLQNMHSNTLLNLLLEFKRLSLFQKEKIISSIKKYANPSKNNIFNNTPKTKCKDYRNWINEAQQIFMLLDDSVLFGIGDFIPKELNIRTGNMGLISNNTIRLKRSVAQKNAYYVQHNIDPVSIKGLGFELHHIVPLAYARSQNDFSTLDRWENMILIDGHSHAIITQNGNKNIELNFNGFDILFKDFQNPPHIVKCLYDKQVKYNISLQNLMKQTNQSLIFNT